MNKDNSHSWVRISHGLNKLVTNLNNNEQEIPEVQLEEYALKFLVLSSIGLTKSGRAAWQEEETGKDTSIVLIHQTSELFKAIQDAVSLILLHRTMLLFRTVSSSTFIMSDVQSSYIPSSIRG